jgi:hypothetical protein
MMQHPWELRFLFTRDTDTSLYTALKVGRRSGTRREKGVTPEFGEYRRRKFIPPKFRALHVVINKVSYLVGQPFISTFLFI